MGNKCYKSDVAQLHKCALEYINEMSTQVCNVAHLVCVHLVNAFQHQHTSVLISSVNCIDKSRQNIMLIISDFCLEVI